MLFNISWRLEYRFWILMLIMHESMSQDNEDWELIEINFCVASVGDLLREID